MLSSIKANRIQSPHGSSDMAYQALARKWRPRSFQDVVGQTSTLRILTHALEKNRLHHAYLFTGTRGVGKTTLARILAKCLNCEKGVTPSPCGTCANCEAIDTGKFLDLYEIDAASRTKVEDTRDLLDNVSYPPTMGRYKVYLIDEVHMLSQHSFNALLKTLEEPPEHVKFLLATTDPKRLPITILSRCLQFHLKHMTPDVIKARLMHIATAENMIHSEEALQLLAKAANGSMRDALSLLDQAIAFGAGSVNELDVRTMLGSVSQGDIAPLLEALAKEDCTLLFATLKQVMDTVGDAQSILEETINVLHAAAIMQLVQRDHETTDICHYLAKHLSPETLQLYYQIAILGRRDLGLAPTPQQGIEMVFLRMLAFTLQPQEKNTTPSKEPCATKVTTSNITPDIAHTITETPAPAANSVKPTNDKITPSTQANNALPWHDIVQKLSLSGMAQMLAINCILEHKSDNQIHLVLSKQHASMLTDKLKDRIQTALSQHFAMPLTLSITVGDVALATPAQQFSDEKKMQQQVATDKISQNPLIKHFLDRYDTTLDITMLSS